MGTILDYLKEYGGRSFLEKPFNNVDSLVLSQFSYLKFEGLVAPPEAGADFIEAEELVKRQAEGNLFADERYEKENRSLFEEMLSGRRYGTIKLNYYVNLIEPEQETQFSAITFLLENGEYYIAYRGTDETIIGWKEDFNLAFSRPLQGQLYSAQYLDAVGKQIPGRIYVGGHSKGGNLAVYASMNCKKEIQDRILKIYSHDGPGFRPELLEKKCYEAIADRIVKTIPQSSVIGMLLESHEEYEVVESKTFGVMQHNPFTWKVEGDHFLYVEDIYSGRKFMDRTINEWILSLDERQIQAFIDTLFQVIGASKTDNLIDFTADWKNNRNAVLSALKEVDEESREVLREIIRSLFELATERAKKEIQFRAESGLQKLSEKAEENKIKIKEKAEENKRRLQDSPAQSRKIKTKEKRKE